MIRISNGASSPHGATARSLEAYLLPHLLDVAATSLGRISALFVGEYAPVVEGQPLARVERTWQWPLLPLDFGRDAGDVRVALLEWIGGNIGPGRTALEEPPPTVVKCPACQQRACIYIVAGDVGSSRAR